MKKRLAMIVTMLMVTVSMAACGGKKDTTADKESVINTEATEEVAETEEPATEEVEAATETEEPETEQETTGKLENNTASTTATTAQPSDNNTSKSNKSNSNSGNKASAGSTASAGTTTSNSSGTTGSSNSNTDNSNTNASNNNAAPAHEHKWVLHEGSGHYETQVVKEAWDEPIYETQARSICNQCGADITDNIDEHFMYAINNGLDCGGWHIEYIKTQTGVQHHDAETKQVYVQDVAPYAQCSGCGEIGPVGSGISIN